MPQQQTTIGYEEWRAGAGQYLPRFIDETRRDSAMLDKLAGTIGGMAQAGSKPGAVTAAQTATKPATTRGGRGKR